VIEVAGDHLAPWMNAAEFSRGTHELVRHVAAQRHGTEAAQRAVG
jgi:hypothetical protein